MPDVADEGVHNRLLLALPSASLERLRPHLHPTALVRGQQIDITMRQVERHYFVDRGFVSMVMTMRDGRSVEVGGVGVEGVTDSHSLFGAERAALDTMVQIPGTAWRIEREALKRAMAADGDLNDLLRRYSRFAFRQVALIAACNRLHSLEERCCRWLLIAHDSALEDTFPLTHEFLAMMLGVNRAGVSIAANLLKRAGMIDYARGRVTITDRAGLEDSACECYSTLQDELQNLFLPGSRTEPS